MEVYRVEGGLQVKKEKRAQDMGGKKIKEARPTSRAVVQEISKVSWEPMALQRRRQERVQFEMLWNLRGPWHPRPRQISAERQISSEREIQAWNSRAKNFLEIKLMDGNTGQVMMPSGE
jgi:hypothetical protein